MSDESHNAAPEHTTTPLIWEQAIGPNRRVEIREPFKPATNDGADLCIVATDPTTGRVKRLSIGLRRHELVRVAHQLLAVWADRCPPARPGPAARARAADLATRAPGEPPASFTAGPR